MPDVPQAAVAAGAASGLLAYWLRHYFASVARPPELFVGEGRLKEVVLPHLSHLHRPYRPTIWGTNTHVQTGLGLLRKLSITGSYSRQLLLSNDGGTFSLDWWCGCDVAAWAAAEAPVVLVCHGINGGSHEGYCKWACQAAAGRRWRAAVLNCRGCNGLELTSPRGYNATMTSDVHLGIASIKARFPGAPVFAVGYSLGAIILSKYLAEADSGLYSYPETGCDIPSSSSSSSSDGRGTSGGGAGCSGSGLAAAAGVSSPVCMTNAMQNLSKPWTVAFAYNLAVAYKLREFIHEHKPSVNPNGPFDIDAALNAWTVQEIENVGLAGQFGFGSREEYYEASASLQYIPCIRTPTLLLTSTDDPFLGVLPDRECAANPYTLLATTSHGGHVAFTQGHAWPLGPAYMDDAVMEFFEVTLSNFHGHAQAGVRAKL